MSLGYVLDKLYKNAIENITKEEYQIIHNTILSNLSINTKIEKFNWNILDIYLYYFSKSSILLIDTKYLIKEIVKIMKDIDSPDNTTISLINILIEFINIQMPIFNSASLKQIYLMLNHIKINNNEISDFLYNKIIE